MNEKDEILKGILLSAGKHPNSRVSKFIRNVEADPTQKSIVLLLIEIAEHAEYCTDFNISLKYYLDLFEYLGFGCDILLNETGLLLLNSSKIYSRRVDYVHELIERQILTLSNSDREISEAKNDQESNTTSKQKRGRKRLLETPKDPYEVELVPKKIRKISNEKRFNSNSANVTAATAQAKMKAAHFRQTESEQHIHPAAWIHSSIVDLENEDEIDSKRNYKLFTYHIEHRYNTLVPDINFRLHFMVKDFIDEEEEQLEESFKENGQYPPEGVTIWPPLSEEYVEQYLNLENKILKCGQPSLRKKADRQEAVQEDSTRVNDDIINETAAKEKLPTQNTTDETIDVGSEILKVNQNMETIENIDKNERDQSIATETMNSSTNTVNEYNNSAINSISTMSNESTALDSSSNAQNTSVASSALDSCTNTPNKSLGYDSALGSSIMDSNTSAGGDTTGNAELDSSTNVQNTSVASSALDSCTNTPNKSLGYDSALGSSIMDSNTSAGGDTTGNAELDSSTNVQNTSVASSALDSCTNTPNKSLEYDSALGSSILDSNTSAGDDDNENKTKESNLTEGKEKIVAEKENLQESDSTILTYTSHEDDLDNDRSINLPSGKDKTHDDTHINLGDIRIRLPHFDDEGVFFSDLDEQEQRMLSPTVMALDVFPQIPNKNNLTIVVDDDIRAMLNLSDEEPETYEMPLENRRSPPSIILNIMKIKEKIFKRRTLFKLGSEYNLYLQARMRKRTRPEEEPTRQYRPIKLFKWFHLNDPDMSGIHVSPVSSPDHRSLDFYGFSDSGDDGNSMSEFNGFPEDGSSSDEIEALPGHRLSRDSGVGVDGPVTAEKTLLQHTIKEGRGVDCINVNNENSNEEENPNQIVDDRTSETVSNNGNQSGNDNTVNNSDNKSTEAESTEVSLTNCSTNSRTELNVKDLTKIQPTLEVEPVNIVNAMVTNGKSNEKDPEVMADKPQNSSDLEEGDENDSFDVCRLDSSHESQTFDSCAALYNKSNTESSGIIPNINTDLNEALSDINLNSSKTKIQRWHEHLQPILAKSRERHHFDVFELGTQIMKELEEGKRSQETEDTLSKPPRINFQDVMENKDASCVSRFFLSSLLLANQSNIQITVENKDSEQPSEWKDIKFELLSTKRHTVSIEDNIGMLKEVAKPTLLQTLASSSKRSTKNGKNPTTARLDMEQCDVVTVNLDDVKPLKQIPKPPHIADDYDSGIFSGEDMT